MMPTVPENKLNVLSPQHPVRTYGHYRAVGLQVLAQRFLKILINCFSLFLYISTDKFISDMICID